MRLTLRTLLAYLDDILDPVDKEQLAQKIESSEFAEDLVHRTRDTVRRLRLSAPQVIGSGMGLDPNTVAEYLDNVLPPDSVADFERICLESDMHLAEAAACHHVLTMVLGEPADVDPLIRQRMYTISSEAESRKRVRVESAHVAVATAPSAAPVQVVASPAGVVPAPSDGERIPEYLRTSSWAGYRGALAALAAVVLVAAALIMFSGLGGWFGGTRETTALTADTTNGLAQNAANPNAQVPATGGGIPGRENTIDENSVAPATSSPPQTGALSQRQAPDGASGSVPLAAAEPGQDESTVQNGATVPQVAASNPAATPAEATSHPQTSVDSVQPPTRANDLSSSETEPLANAPAEPVAASLEQAGVTADARAEENVADAADVRAENGAPQPPSAGETTVAEEVPTGPAELGTYLGGKTILLRYDDKSGAWFRVQPRSAVTAGERLLALPEFRPKITLSSGVHVDISGGTQVTMRTAEELPGDGLPAAAAAEPGVEVIYGRVILINTSGDEQPVRLALGASVAAARLARNATLAIEVERKYVAGNDPRKSPAPVIARLYAPDGGVAWQDAGGAKTISNASRWTISEASTSQVVADSSPPKWIDEEPVVQLSEQRYAAPKIEGLLVSDRPADMQLLEIFQSNAQREMKSLAAKSSIHVGVFEPFIDALRDSEQKANWRTHIETLRSAMALSPDSAANVWKALVEQRDRKAAADLYEMLCGYNEEQIGRTPDQVKSGALVRLIRWLEEDSLDYRVLAVHDLWEITGKRLMPDPAAGLKERTQNIRRWRTRLDEGDLQPVRR